MNRIFCTILPIKDIGHMPACYIQKFKPEGNNRTGMDIKWAKLHLFLYEHVKHKSSIWIDDTYVITLFYREY